MKKMTTKEQMVLAALFEYALHHGDNGCEFVLEEVEKALEIGTASLAGVLSSLQSKGLVEEFNDTDTYFDGAITEEGLELMGETH